MIHLVNDTSEIDLKDRHARFGALNDRLKKRMDEHSRLMAQLKQISKGIDQDISEMMKSARGANVLKKADRLRKRSGLPEGTPTAA